MSAKTKLVLGLVGAAAAGVVVGLLLAPDSGAATRRKIADTASDWTDQLSDLFASAKDQVDELKRKGAKAATSASRKAAEVKESYM